MKWREFREFDRKGIFIERVSGWYAWNKRGYVFDRRLFLSWVLLLLAGAAFVFVASGVGWREFYVHCPEDQIGFCRNPYYLACDFPACRPIMFQEYLYPGFTLGRAPPEEYTAMLFWLGASGVLSFILAVCVNHRVHNRGRKLADMLPVEE